MISEVAKSGDRRATLEALRDIIASAIDDGPEAKDLAALSLRMQLVLGDLAEMDAAEMAARPAGGRESVKDALAARRKAKEASAG